MSFFSPFPPGNVNLMLYDDCMPFSSDFFLVLFTHCVMAANKDIFLTVQCTVCSRYMSLLYRVLICCKDVTLYKHKLFFLVFSVKLPV